MKFGRSLRLFVLVFMLVPIFIFGILVQRRMEQEVNSAMEDSMETISSMEVSYINSFFDTRREYLELLSKNSDVQSVVSESFEGREIDEETLKRVNKDLKMRKSFISTIESLSIIDANFKDVASSEDYTLGADSMLANANSDRISGKFTVGHVYNREIEGREATIVAAYCGIYDSADRLIGYIVQEVDISYFDQLRCATTLTDDCIICLADTENNIITAGTSNEAADLSNKDSEEYAVFSAIDLNQEGKGSLNYSVKGIDWIVNYDTIEYTNWHIFICANTSEYMKDMTESRNSLYSILVVFTLIIIFVSYHITDKITKPIDTIIGTLRKVEQEQDYSIRIRSDKKDEMGILSKRIDHLLDYVETADAAQKVRQEILEDKADRDSLTGIYNQHTTDIKIDEMLKSAGRHNTNYALGFLDIDNFRDFNTEYGHQEGDRVIRFVAECLQLNFGDNVGRNGGDEFLFWLGDAGEKEVLEQKMVVLCETLRKGYFSKSLAGQVSVPCSIGLVYDKADDKMSRKVIISHADRAMYRTKNNGKNGFTFYGD